MKFLIIVLLFVSSRPSRAQEECVCKSQLVKIDVDSSALNQTLGTSEQIERILLPLTNYMNADGADGLKSQLNLLRKYDVTPFAFSPNADACATLLLRKPGAVNCKDPDLCADPQVDLKIRAELCDTLPCSVILGPASLKPEAVNKCPTSDTSAIFSTVHFKQEMGSEKENLNNQVNLKEFDFDKDIKVTAEPGNKIKACFTITKFITTVGAEVEFAKVPGVNLERVGLKNFTLNLADDNTKKRQVCMIGKVDFATKDILSGMKFETGDNNLISDEMLEEALSNSQITGFSGYRASTLQWLKGSVGKNLAKHFRPGIEKALKESLEQTFQQTIGEYTRKLRPKRATTITAGSDSFVSELGMANITAGKSVDLLECSLAVARKKQFAPKDPCLDPVAIWGKKKFPKLTDALNLLVDQFERFDQVTSERLKTRLKALKTEISLTSPHLSSKLDAVISKISQNQTNSELLKNVQIITELNENSNNSVSVGLPDICDTTNPSIIADKKVKDCNTGIQAFVDLNEMNRLLEKMYQTGRLCHSGKGDYTLPPGVVDSDKKEPKGSGCFLALEDGDKGFRCFLNGPPSIKYFSEMKNGIEVKGYKVDTKMHKCFRNGYIGGLGKVTGSLDLSVSYTPSFCGDGDFCLENGKVDGNFDLQISKWFDSTAQKTVKKTLDTMLKESMRLPLSSGAEAFTNIPVVPVGSPEIGPGYFGACLKAK
ncbi:MAG TPA: hypothetical protein VNJ01_13350 [Bacteriovoracaceae bacterium]|nr:hypothetical protein [Bacteriovoracaceae bacterium]